MNYEGGRRRATPEQETAVFALAAQGKSQRKIATEVCGDPRLKDRVRRMLARTRRAASAPDETALAELRAALAEILADEEPELEALVRAYRRRLGWPHPHEADGARERDMADEYVLPQLGPRAFQALLATIAEQGVLEPIVVSAGPALAGAIADGGERERACAALGIACPREQRPFATEPDFHPFRLPTTLI